MRESTSVRKFLYAAGPVSDQPWLEMGSRLTTEVGIWLAGHSSQVCLRADRSHLRHENDALRFVLGAFHFQTRVDRLHLEHGATYAWHLARGRTRSTETGATDGTEVTIGNASPNGGSA